MNPQRSVLVTGAGSLLGQGILRASRASSLQLRIIAVGTAVNIVLNFLLIPVWGIAGAAASTVTAEGLILLLVSLVLRRMGVCFQARPICRPLLAAVLMIAVLLGLVVIGLSVRKKPY